MSRVTLAKEVIIHTEQANFHRGDNGGAGSGLIKSRAAALWRTAEREAARLPWSLAT
jgi:hypothetical protein